MNMNLITIPMWIKTIVTIWSLWHLFPYFIFWWNFISWRSKYHNSHIINWVHMYDETKQWRKTIRITFLSKLIFLDNHIIVYLCRQHVMLWISKLWNFMFIWSTSVLFVHKIVKQDHQLQIHFLLLSKQLINIR